MFPKGKNMQSVKEGRKIMITKTTFNVEQFLKTSSHNFLAFLVDTVPFFKYTYFQAAVHLEHFHKVNIFIYQFSTSRKLAVPANIFLHFQRK